MTETAKKSAKVSAGLKCVICSQELTGSQKLYCSDKCGDRGFKIRRRSESREQVWARVWQRPVCVVCGVELAGSRREYCSRKCWSAGNRERRAEQQRGYRERHPELRHDTCICGSTKDRRSELCQKCTRAAKAAISGGRKYKPERRDLCECGAVKLARSRRCGLCAARVKREAVAKEREGGDPHDVTCAIAGPHNHCKYCLWPIPADAGMCAACIREVERGACMTPRESRKFEEAA